MNFTTTIAAEGDGYIALCPELDVVSQGDSIDEASANLREAVDLLMEIADWSEVKRRLRARGIVVPLIADIHFSPAAALEAHTRMPHYIAHGPSVKDMVVGPAVLRDDVVAWLRRVAAAG